MAQSHTPCSSCVRFVALVASGSRNTRLQVARYALPGLDFHQRIAPASWRLPQPILRMPALLLTSLSSPRLLDQLEQLRRRHRQRARPHPDHGADGVCDRRHGGGDRYLADTAQPVRMSRIGYFDDLGVDHRHIGRHGHAIVEEARVLQPSVLAIDILLVERPADALHGAPP